MDTLTSLMFLSSAVISKVDEDDRIPVTHFKKLHLQSIDKFQSRITQLAAQTENIDGLNDDDHDKLHGLLHRYVEAVNDLEKMNIRPQVRKPRFVARPAEHIEATTTESKFEAFELVEVLAPGPPKAVLKWKEVYSDVAKFALDTIIQLIFAGTMGAALVVPMLIMVLIPSRENSLIVTCVFVFSFASALVVFNVLAYLSTAWLPVGMGRNALDGSVLQVKDIVGATAAYAAVLVVFVGTSTSIT